MQLFSLSSNSVAKVRISRILPLFQYRKALPKTMARNLLSCSVLCLALITLNICSSEAQKQATDDASVEDLKEKVNQLTEILKQQGELLKILVNERKTDERKPDESKSGSTIGKLVEAASWAYFGYETAKELCSTNAFDGFSVVSRIKKYACPSKKFSLFSG